MNWIIENKEWVFSGIGVLIVSVIIGFFVQNRFGKKIAQNSREANPVAHSVVTSENQSGGITAENVTFNQQTNYLKEPQIPIEENFYVKIHRNFKKERNTIEIRPLQGKWYPFFVGILHREITAVDPQIEYAPAGSIPRMSMTGLSKNPPTENTDWQFFIGHQPATPENSYFISCNKLPSSISFGETDSSKAKYKYEFGNSPLLCDD